MHEGGSLFANPRFWVAVAFVIFAVLFWRRIWDALKGMLDKRIASVKAELAEAQRLREEAEAMLRDATARREHALDEAKALLDGAKAEAQRLADAAAAEAQAAAQRREQMAMDRIAAAEKSAVDEVRTTAATIATQAAGAVIRDTLTPEQDTMLIDHAVASLPAALAQRRAA
jgi:F-type H+-transporting ATPase subunit b